ncbi:MAG: hypothetical protein IJ719_11955 [Clostridia bacterium]|nr:hypothetical protein [Clostridia bacterium]
MYNNVGGKIKGFALVLCIIGIIARVIVGGYFIVSDSDLQQSLGLRRADHNLLWVGALIIVGGSFISWLGCLGIYGFGELIESSRETKKNSREILDLLKQTSNKEDIMSAEDDREEDDSYGNGSNGRSLRQDRRTVSSQNCSKTETVDV